MRLRRRRPVSPKTLRKFLAAGWVDVILTMGDHVWDKPDIFPYLGENARKIVRPANFPEGVPGVGWTIVEAPNGGKVGVINLLGRTFMRYNVACPFLTLDAIVAEIKKQTPVIIVDMHAEATSEKVALGHFCRRQGFSLVFGTHTHIQTADEKILPQGTAYITDLGMSGPYDSVIGQDKAKIISRYMQPACLINGVKWHRAAGTVHGVIIKVDTKTGRAEGISRLQMAHADKAA